MSEFILATASTCDLDRDWLDAHEIPFISYTFEIDGDVIADDCRDKTKRKLYALMREGKAPNTSQINEYVYYRFFMELLQKGKPVLFADMDKAITGAYSNSLRAAETIKEEHPEYELYILDTRAITAGLGFLIKHMEALREEGKTMQEVIDWAEANKLRVVHRFMIDDLKWLRKGGRLSNAASIAGTLLSLKPLVQLPDDGSLIAFEKPRGRKKAMRLLVEYIGKDIGDSFNKEMIVMHSDCPEDAQALKEKILEAYPYLKSVEIMELGPVIAAHIGPDFLATVYFSENNRGSYFKK